MQFSYLYFLSIIVLLNSCFSSNKIVQEGYYSLGESIPYDFAKPKATYLLDNELYEISGLTYDPKSKMLIAINDEYGVLYSINHENGTIVKEIDFGKKGDFEGVAEMNGNLYIVKSNGYLYSVDPENGEIIDQHKTNLKRKNNIEGLTYDDENKVFLFAAKGDSRIKGHKKGNRSIFVKGISSNTINKVPFLQVNLKQEVENYFLEEETKMDEKYFARVREFAPSGIAIHPKSRDMYILSYRGNMLVVFDKNKSFKSVVFLSEKDYKQPEGICFLPDGTLMIANEGAGGGSASIMKINLES